MIVALLLLLILVNMMVQYSRWMFPMAMPICERLIRWFWRQAVALFWRAPVRRFGVAMTLLLAFVSTVLVSLIATALNGSQPVLHRLAAGLLLIGLLAGLWALLRWWAVARFRVRPLPRRS